MPSHRTLFPQSDDRQALEQLERLHREIQNARRQRERAAEEFDGFVAGFQDPHEPSTRPRAPVPSRRPRVSVIARSPASSSQPAAAPSTPRPLEIARPSGTARPQHALTPRAAEPSAALETALPPPTPVPEAVPTQPAPPAPLYAASTKRPRARMIGAILTGALVVLAAAIAIYVSRSRTPHTSTRDDAATRPAAPAVVLPHADIESRPPLAPSAEPPPLHVEIVAVRDVWLRATVDGHRAIERQVPAGTRLTFTPTDSITIRAGDAGAVRLKIGDRPEEPLGRDGQVLTRVVVVGSEGSGSQS